MGPTFSYSFSSGGVFTDTRGETSDSAPYRTEGARLFIGTTAPLESYVFAVYDNGLYLFTHADDPPPTGADLILRSRKR